MWKLFIAIPLAVAVFSVTFYLFCCGMQFLTDRLFKNDLDLSKKKVREAKNIK